MGGDWGDPHRRVDIENARNLGSLWHNDGSGSKNIYPEWVSHLWVEFGFGNFPLKDQIFHFFLPFGSKNFQRVGSKSTQVKAGSASYLLRVKSMFGSGRTRAHLHSGLPYQLTSGQRMLFLPPPPSLRKKSTFNLPPPSPFDNQITKILWPAGNTCVLSMSPFYLNCWTRWKHPS